MSERAAERAAGGSDVEPRREALVLDAVVTLVDSLLHDFDLVDLLTELTEQCSQLLDVASTALLLADPRGWLRLMAATSERTEELELFQLQADEGPCRDCFASGEPVSVADLTDAVTRWPRFAPAAIEAGFVSVHAVPMRAANTVLGVLGLFGTQAGELNEPDLLVAWSLAHIASVAIVQEHPPTPVLVLPRLRSALARRVAVEQAKGFVRERLDVTVGEAFTLLRRLARTRGAHLSEIAAQLVSAPAASTELTAALDQLVGGARHKTGTAGRDR